MIELLERFAKKLGLHDTETLSDVEEYIAWQVEHRADFSPSPLDDVDLRTYFLELRISGEAEVQPEHMARKASSLKRFYEWAHKAGLIPQSPFDRFNFDHALLTPEQVRVRRDAYVNGQDREIARLQALNRLMVHLNHSVDVKTAFDSSLKTLVEVMGLRTAWISLLADSGLAQYSPAIASSSKFVLAAACNLPPALEQDNYHFLSKSPECHCQALLRQGRLGRAVNIVECTRLQEASQAAGDNRTGGLLFHATVPIMLPPKAGYGIPQKAGYGIPQKAGDGIPPKAGYGIPQKPGDGMGDRPLGNLNVATDEWQLFNASDLQLLSAFGVQIAVMLDRTRLYEVANAQRQRMESELKMARALQINLLPSRLPEIPGFNLAASWHSVREVAGDFYDVFPLPGGRWGILVGDVCDKGVPAAMYMVLARSLIRSGAQLNPSPAKLLVQVNRALIEQSPNDMFVSVFYGVIDPAKRSLTYSLAGHNPPFLGRATEDQVERLLKGGPVIGVLPKVRLSDARVTFSPGDVLVAYTDGLTEAFDNQEEQFGEQRLEEVIREHKKKSARKVLDSIEHRLHTFIDGASQSDDITLLVMKCEK
jgi:serine phosphatase RsbU (regulator of sigma subunit)